jgi:hypothetical protein
MHLHQTLSRSEIPRNTNSCVPCSHPGYASSAVLCNLHTNSIQLSGNDIENVESTVAAYITQFLGLIESKIESAQDKTARLDLSNTIPLLTLDMIAHLCIGESFDSIQRETDSFELFKALNVGMLIQQYIAVLTEATKVLLTVGKLPWFRTRLFPKGSNSNGIGRVMLVSD